MCVVYLSVYTVLTIIISVWSIKKFADQNFRKRPRIERDSEVNNTPTSVSGNKLPLQFQYMVIILIQYFKFLVAPYLA